MPKLQIPDLSGLRVTMLLVSEESILTVHQTIGLTDY